MTKKRRTEIVIETRQLFFMKNVESSAVSFCGECGAEMFKPEIAALLSGIGTREIYRRVETGTIHFIERQDGSLDRREGMSDKT